MPSKRLGFYEFFSGGGMARLGLGRRWECLFANDSCQKKARAYRSNFNGAPELTVGDVGRLSTADLPGKPSLVWASFPCQDLSLAGNGAGLKGERSGTFWPFWRLMETLIREGRGSPLIVLENVVGAITSNGGRDFRAILQAVSGAGYRVGALVINLGLDCSCLL
jgi:DNA (cytosine-5)-methyltransferase 1